MTSHPEQAAAPALTAFGTVVDLTWLGADREATMALYAPWAALFVVARIAGHRYIVVTGELGGRIHLQATATDIEGAARAVRVANVANSGAIPWLLLANDDLIGVLGGDVADVYRGALH